MMDFAKVITKMSISSSEVEVADFAREVTLGSKGCLLS